MRTIVPIVAAIVLIQHGCGDKTNKGNKNAFTTPVKPSIPGGGGTGKKAPAVHIPLLQPIRGGCSGNNLGLYTWGYEVWNNTQSPAIEFLTNPASTDYSCGDIWINVADYSAPNYIRDEYALVPFIRNVRATGNRATVLLVYGDVNVGKNGAPNGPSEFADTFFRWISQLSQDDLSVMLPLGISFDCEHLSDKTIRDALTHSQQLKEAIRESKLGGDASKIVIEWTIEGERKPVDTDVVMRLADRALMMGYRNHMATSIRDPNGEDTIMTRLFTFMFREQCEHCLDDAYAIANYKATIKLMFEADCMCGSSCHKISFCAYDARAPGWGNDYRHGAEYMMATLRQLDNELRNGGRLTPAQHRRLFGEYRDMELFVVHNWQWFTCFFDNPSVAVSTPIGAQHESCKNYHTFANSCRGSN